MTAKILRTAVDDDISAKRQRTLQIRCKESVINDRELVMLFSDLGNCFDISNREKRVCRSLDIDRLNVVVDSSLNCFKIRSVYDLISYIEVLEYYVIPS